jgi:hypothetical protein
MKIWKGKKIKTNNFKKIRNMKNFLIKLTNNFNN